MENNDIVIREASVHKSIKIAFIISLIMLLCLIALVLITRHETKSDMDKLYGIVLPVSQPPGIPFEEFNEYGGQLEVGNTNMIYMEITAYDGTPRYLVRVNKNNVFSYEREFPSREMAIKTMQEYELYLRSR